MGKYRRYKNRIEMFLASERGKRILNFCYSWGASIVIIGALFKLLHLPYGNQILLISMSVEALVFFVSAFERPDNEYRWEEVFPVLKSKNPMDRPDFAGTPVSSMINSNENMEDDSTSEGMNLNIGTVGNAGLGNLNLEVSADDTKKLSDSIQKLNGAAEQISKMAELMEASQKYMQQLSDTARNMEKFSQITGSIADMSDGISTNSKSYAEQMEMLNRNIVNLNSAYDMQMRSINSQLDSIQHINGGLGRIREMYDNSVVDSSIFRSENEKMARQLSELNQVYARLLQAMTVNMGFQQPQAPQQPAYQQQPYGQPVYQQPYGYQQAQQNPNSMNK